MTNLPPALPHDTEAEQTLLGILFHNPDYFLEIYEKVSPQDFYHEKHRKILLAFQRLYLEQGRVEYAELMKAIVGNGISVAYLQQCEALGEVYRSTGWALRKVLETSSRRRLLEGLHKVSGKIGSISEKEITEQLLDLVVSVRRHKGKVYSGKEIAKVTHKEMESNADLGTIVTGMPTGFDRVDLHTRGLHPQRITVISGPTGHGKTTTALNWMANICIRHKVPGLFVTLEMRDVDIGMRILAILSGQDLGAIERGHMNHEIIQAFDAFRNGNLYISDNTSRTVQDVCLLIEKYAILHGIKVWCLDYIGRLSRDNPKMREDRDERFARWVKLLWGVTQRHNLHGIIVSQVNVYEQIAESKKIEHEADHVFFFKYVKEESRHVLECRKNRFGPAWYRYLVRFNRSNQRMQEEGILKGEV